MEERGETGSYEDFDYGRMLRVGPDGRLQGLDTLDHEARLLMIAAHREGRIMARTPEEIVSPYEQSVGGHVTAYAVLPVAEARWLVGRSRLRWHRFNPPVPPWELAGDLAVAALGDQLKAYLTGEVVEVGVDEVARIVSRTQGWDRRGARHLP